jgi:PAS domain S-box-containing protein
VGETNPGSENVVGRDHAPTLPPHSRVSPHQLRFHRSLLLYGGGAYLGWWLFVELALPGAFNPLPGRALVVACFGLALAASYAWRSVAERLPDALAACCGLATAHYFYLLERNDADVNWVIGSYITITAVCAILQTARSLLFYSMFVAVLSVVLLVRAPALSFVVFMPGTLTILLFANVGLRSRLALLAELQESHRRIASLFDAGFEGISVEEHGVIREINGALSRLVGQPREQMIGRKVDDILTPLAAAPHASADETPREAELIRKDGSRIAVEVIGKRHVINGKTVRLLAIRDLTARKQAEAALLFANRELESFSYSVAHDLRAPLRGIDGFSVILLEDCSDGLDATGRGHLQKVRAEALRMGELIDDLLELARVGRAELSRQRIDLSGVASQVVDQLRSQAPDRAVITSIQDGIFVDADRRLLLIVLENLIGNAWKFTSKAPAAKIEIVAATGSEGAVISVRDNGAGFDMAFSSKLFTPFQRLHAVDEFPGTGIGLATVQRIVERHGGRVWAESSVDHGATFHLTLQPAGYRRDGVDAE